MATYTNYAEMDNEISSLAQYEPADKNIYSWVDSLILFVEDEINGRLAHRYSVPFTPTPKLIAHIAREFTAYRILRPNFVKENPSISDWVDEYRRRGEELLVKLESGELLLPDSSEVNVVGNTKSSTEAFNPVFRQRRIDKNNQVVEPGNMQDL